MLIDKELRTIGFAGCGQQELIGGCAVLFVKQGKKVLIMDFSENGEMRSVIPLPADLEEAKNVILSYLQYDYIRIEGNMQICDFSFDYDIVLADFGNQASHPETGRCDRLYYVTDMRRHNVLLFKHLEKRENQYLVLKNYRKEKGKAEAIANELEFQLSDFYVLPYEEKEAAQFLCESRIDELNLLKYSNESKELLGEILKDGEDEPYQAGPLHKRRRGLW